MENLAAETIRDIHVGVFKSSTQKQSWSYAEAFTKTVPLLSAKQSIAISIEEFKNEIDFALELSDKPPVYVDCWVQDQHGIFLFNFLLNE